jgi:transposase
MRKPRKNDTPVEKVAISRRHLIDHVPVSDLCDEHQLSPTVFYLWQKPFFENGSAAFERKNATRDGHLQRTIAALRDKLQRKNEVVAELMEEHIKLKKSLGSSARRSVMHRDLFGPKAANGTGVIGSRAPLVRPMGRVMLNLVTTPRITDQHAAFNRPWSDTSASGAVWLRP